MSMFKYLKLLIMSRIQEYGLCIKAGHSFLLLGIGNWTFAYIKCISVLCITVGNLLLERAVMKIHVLDFLEIVYTTCSRPFLPMLCNNSTYTT